MQRLPAICLLAAILMAVSACGIKGPLYLPAETTASEGLPPLESEDQPPQEQVEEEE